MVELKKYKIGVRRFRLINWIGFYSLYKKETLRFLIVSGQTILGPVVTAVLFLMVISLALGENRGTVLGVPFIEFLAPGLISMQIIQQSFAHSSSSILSGKMMGNIVDLVGSPLSAIEVTLAIIFASITRALMISFLSIFVFSFFIEIRIENFLYFSAFLFLSSFSMGAMGFVAGMWSDKWENMAAVTNFVIVPMSFLSGTFYSINKLPEILQKISFLNPFFHIIDGLRFSFIGNSDGSIKFGLIYLFLFGLIVWFLSFLLYKKGYKIRN